MVNCKLSECSSAAWSANGYCVNCAIEHNPPPPVPSPCTTSSPDTKKDIERIEGKIDLLLNHIAYHEDDKHLRHAIRRAKLDLEHPTTQ